ncbi:MAG TPA: hypothetical protein VFX58_03240 [Chitinophagaceae bacterium]|nr:hypothetical protein [Chitinophagaceae bacterium]
MRKFWKKYSSGLAFILCVAVIAGIYGYREYTRELPDTKELMADYNLKAADLVRRFETNEDSANSQYNDRVITVHGIISAVQVTDSSGTVFLNEGSSLASVMCQFDQENLPGILELQKGAEITIKGVCSGYLFDVILLRCVLE